MTRPTRWLALLLIVMGGCATTAPRPASGPVDGLSAGNDVMRVHFIDIGQGLSALIELPCAAVLVDGGGELNDSFDGLESLERYLDAFFARRTDLDRTLALVVATHPHLDHTRGLPAVAERYRVQNVVDNGMDRGSGGRQQAALQEWVRAQGGRVGYRAVKVADIPPEGLTDDVIDPVRCEGTDPRLRVLWGRLGEDPGWGGNRYGRTHFANANNHSVVLRVDFGEASALFAGDLEPPAIGELLRRTRGSAALDTDLYQVAHHGSSNGTTPALVAAMTPELAVFAAGPHDREEPWTAWQHGHPRLRVLEMLEAGVDGDRAPVTVWLGTGRHRFEQRVVQRAIYSVGWDGTVVAEGRADGSWRVLTSGLAPRAPADGDPEVDGGWPD